MTNALSPAVRGKRFIDLKEQDGEFIAQEWIRIARRRPITAGAITVAQSCHQ
jgi:hypothetical protein